MKPRHVKGKRNLFGSGPGGLVIFVVVFAVGLALLSGLTKVSHTVLHLQTTDFFDYVEQGKIASVVISGNEVYGELKNPAMQEFERLKLDIASDQAQLEHMRQRKQNVQKRLDAGDKTAKAELDRVAQQMITLFGQQEKLVQRLQTLQKSPELSKAPTHFQARLVQVDAALMEKLRAHGIRGELLAISGTLGYLSYTIGILIAILALAAIIALFRFMRSSGGSGGGGSGIFNFSRSRAKLILPAMVKERFADVAGATEAKQQLFDVIDFLKNPDKYHRMGAKIPRGILLVGEPGNGKTLLARAVAGEAGVPFFSISGSDFIEVFVGVGAARVRDLFEQARKKMPAIIFIDEIDAIGRHRGSGLGGGHDEREQTLNQLLTELDGFDSTDLPVVVMAATNIPEVLDKALLRPGRFDMQVEVPYPDTQAREDILRIHARGKTFGADVDFKVLAQDTAGFSGADLSNLINSAAIGASKAARSIIEQADLQEAFRKIFQAKQAVEHKPSLMPKGSGHARMFMPSQVKFGFKDVAGIPEAKEEVQDIVDFLRNPKKYKSMGARVPHGVLLVGEPGNGKTILAKALAGEASCPFFSVSGSEFVEQFVGVGSARVRELFEAARKHAPCIIFIDEIDGVGGQRHGGGGGSQEYAQTLNQLLTEMDGFESSQEPIIVVGATNRADRLDKALLRPGRFDRQVYVPYPCMQSRLDILAVHTRDKKLDVSVDLERIARATSGFSGAQLANLVNEAALQTIKDGRDAVNMHDFEEAHDKIILGKANRTIKRTAHDLEIAAYHEAGHALMHILLPDKTDPLHKVTILPRGPFGGVTFALPEQDTHLKTKDQMIGNIMVALGGRIAEELAFNTITTGASRDFKQATDAARRMVCEYGMSDDLGTVAYGQEYEDFAFSESTKTRIDAAVQAIVASAYDITKKLLTESREKLDALARALLEYETLYASQVYELLQVKPRQDFRLVDDKLKQVAASEPAAGRQDEAPDVPVPSPDDQEPKA